MVERITQKIAEAIQWDQSYSVGIQTFDQHHQRILGLLSALESGGAAGEAGGESVVKALKELRDYSVYHFTAEEKELQAHNYSNLQQQKDEHTKFIGKIENYTAMYLAGSEPSLADVVGFLSDWILNHIHEKDKSYAAFLREKGSR